MKPKMSFKSRVMMTPSMNRCVSILMKLKDIDINKTIEDARKALKKEKNLSITLRAIFEMLLLVITLLAAKFKLNSSNSSVPPSDDPNRQRGAKNKKTGRKPGGQHGHIGSRLEKAAEPDDVEVLKIDRKTLPRGRYKEVGYESRQVINLKISTFITEYRAQILENEEGQQFVAEFPFGVTRDIQYGAQLKSHAVYMSQFQLIPYKRMEDYFSDQMKLELSSGTLFNFNQEAFKLLERFELVVKLQLLQSEVLHVDETGINVNKKRLWLHSTSNSLWTYFYPHLKRGKLAMDEIDILPHFTGILCHDHWKPYYGYACLHALCNGHHLRELTWSADEDHQNWAREMRLLLLEINEAVHEAGGLLSETLQNDYHTRYQKILEHAELECPAPPSPDKPTRGRVKRSKSRNLLERLKNFQDDVLRFMSVNILPFTNNQAENDIRMTKVQQKISGCFRSMEGAYLFCRIRSYLLTCQKHDVTLTDALELLFQARLPDFIEQAIVNHSLLSDTLTLSN